MNRQTEATILVLIGAIIGRLTIQGGYQSFVKTGLFWPLLASSAALIAVGGLTLWQDQREKLLAPAEAPSGHHADLHGTHDTVDHHGHGARVGLLMLAPVAVLLLVAPVSLGSFAADRGQANQLGEPAERFEFPPLPEPVDGATEMYLTEVVERLFYGEAEELEGVPLRIIGFVMPFEDSDQDEYLLTRFEVGCCAADASPRQVLIDNASVVPPTDTWLEVEVRWTGQFVESDRARLPVFALSSQEQLEEPAQPYEY